MHISLLLGLSVSLYVISVIVTFIFKLVLLVDLLQALGSLLLDSLGGLLLALVKIDLLTHFLAVSPLLSG